MTKVIAYIDGFNLYFGMREKFNRKYLWLDLWRLSELFLQEGDELVRVKYFTSIVSPTAKDPDKRRRQTIYLDALRATGIDVILGVYELISIKCKNCGLQISNCPNCGHNIETYKEKKTDVNIATNMIKDAYKGHYDKAFLVSGDRDLVPPIETVLSDFKDKRVFVIFPPKRATKHLQKIASGSTNTKEKHLISSQLSSVITGENGYKLRKPGKWK